MSLWTSATPANNGAAAGIDLRKSTQKISNSFVADTSSEHTYKPKLQLIIMYLFDNNKREYINPNFLEGMVNADAIDRNIHNDLMDRRKKKKTKAKSTIMKRTKLRNFIYHCIDDTPPDDEQNKGHTSPIIIDGVGAITATVVKEYMQTNMNQVWVARDAAEAYIKEINSDVVVTDEMVNNIGKVKCSVYQSKSQYNGIRSSIAYLYTLARVQQPQVMQKEISTFLKGMDRTIRAAKEKLGLKISEGKKALTFEAYSLMAKHLFMSDAKEDIFAHLFLVLDWCLMKRAENCVNAQINHISFGNDCLVFEFAKSKGHQTGEDHVGPWHLYANPHKPWICPKLALARYLLCNLDKLKDGQSLFAGSGKSVYNRYSDRFHKLVLELDSQLSDMGFEIGDLGTHSSRKGVATMIAAGCTVSPPIISICIRAGWAMGGVKDKYLLYGCAGDQYVGRCASCLDQTTKEFAISPPYFDYSTLEGEEKIARKKMVKDFIDSRIGFKEGAISGSTRALVGWCFASICYHYEDLKETYLHPDSTLRMSSLFKDIPEDITSIAVVKYPWNKTEDTPVSTGVPPHVLHMADMHELQLELKSLKQEMKDMKTSLMDAIKQEMTNRGFGSTEHNTGQLMDLITSVTAKQTEALTDIVNRLTEKANLTTTSYQEAVSTSAAEYEDFVMEEEDFVECDIPADATPEQALLSRQNTIRRSNEIVAKRQYKVGIVKLNGQPRFSVLPPSFKKFPSMTADMLIENWFIGNVSANIPPICTLNHGMVKHIQTAGTQLRKMKRVMKFVEITARKNGCWDNKLSIKSHKGWDMSTVKALWAGIERAFKKEYAGKNKRKDELSWTTCYNGMVGKSVE